MDTNNNEQNSRPQTPITDQNETNGGAQGKPQTQPWQGHKINFRLSLPFFGRRFYFTLVAGGEQRDMDRIAKDRAEHPVATLSNVLFGFGLTAIFAFLALVALAMQSAIIEL